MKQKMFHIFFFLVHKWLMRNASGSLVVYAWTKGIWFPSEKRLQTGNCKVRYIQKRKIYVHKVSQSSCIYIYFVLLAIIDFETCPRYFFCCTHFESNSFKYNIFAQNTSKGPPTHFQHHGPGTTREQFN